MIVTQRPAENLSRRFIRVSFSRDRRCYADSTDAGWDTFLLMNRRLNERSIGLSSHDDEYRTQEANHLPKIFFAFTGFLESIQALRSVFQCLHRLHDFRVVVCIYRSTMGNVPYSRTLSLLTKENGVCWIARRAATEFAD